MLKKEDLYNMCIAPKTKEEHQALQRLAFDLGFSWGGITKKEVRDFEANPIHFRSTGKIWQFRDNCPEINYPYEDIYTKGYLPRPNLSEYRVIKPFTLRDIISLGADIVCEPAVMDIFKLMEETNSYCSIDYSFDSADSSLALCNLFNREFAGINGLKWLEIEGYVGKIKEEIFYKLGDEFVDKTDGDTYRIHIVGTDSSDNLIQLLSSKGISFFPTKIAVENINKITQKEFQKLTPHWKDLKKIS